MYITTSTHHNFHSSNTKQQSISQSIKNSNFTNHEKLIKMMISARKLIKMARKWQKVAALRRKRVSFPTKADEVSTSDQVAEKGHFIVYTNDGVRFSLPIAYLNGLIFRELLRMSEEEFGLPSSGPITLPCDSQFLRYITSLMQRKAAKHVEKSLLLSVEAYRCSSSHSLQHQHHQTSHHILLSAC